MPPSTPVDVFTDWLSTRPREARMAIAIDADRLICESGLLGRNTIVDTRDVNGRSWSSEVTTWHFGYAFARLPPIPLRSSS